MKAKSQAPAKFKKYVGKVEKQHLKSKVCRIRVDGGGEYASREKFLEYLAEEGIIRVVSAPYSQQQNGISERCNRSVLDPARSMLKHAGMPNKLWAEAASTAVYIKNRLPSRALPNPNLTPFERWTQKKPDIPHLGTFGCLAFAWIHGDHRKNLDNHANKCVLLGYSAGTSIQYRLMDLYSSRVFISREVKFDESTRYHQLLKTKSTKFAFEPAEQHMDSEIEDQPPVVQPPKAMIQPPKVQVQPPRPTASRHAIIPIDDSDDDLTPPPETPPLATLRPRRSRRTAANVSIAMMIEQGPKTYRATLDAEDAEQSKEPIGKEMASMVSHEVFTFLDKVPEGASMIGSRWVMGRKLMANGSIDKWKVRLVGRGDLQKPGDFNDITSPVIDSASIWLALDLAAKHDPEIAVLDSPTAFVGCLLHVSFYMHLPEGEWPDPYGRARPLVKLNKTLYGIKEVNREYYEDVFDFIVDDLNLQATIAASRLFFGRNLEANGVLIPVYVDAIMIIGTLVLVASIASRLSDQFKGAGQVPVLDTVQYLGIMVTRDCSKRSIAIDLIGYINRVLARLEMTDSRKRSTPMEIGYKPHPIQAEVQPFDSRTYPKAIGSILHAALGTCPDITYATAFLGRYATQPSTLHWEAVKHLHRYL